MRFVGVFIGNSRDSFHRTMLKYVQSATSHRVRDPRVFRDASWRSDIFWRFVHDFSVFVIFRTFLMEFPCWRVRSLSIFVIFVPEFPCWRVRSLAIFVIFCQFRHEIPLFKAPFIGYSVLLVEFASAASELWHLLYICAARGPHDGIRERSERALTLVVPLHTSRTL